MSEGALWWISLGRSALAAAGIITALAALAHLLGVYLPAILLLILILIYRHDLR